MTGNNYVFSNYDYTFAIIAKDGWICAVQKHLTSKCLIFLLNSLEDLKSKQVLWQYVVTYKNLTYHQDHNFLVPRLYVLKKTKTLIASASHLTQYKCLD